MAKQTINNLETGKVVRDKINENFTEVYSDIAINSSGIYSILSYSNDSPIYDGVTSVFTALTNAIADIPSSGGILFFPNTANGGTYKIDTSITIPDNIEVRFGVGANLYRTNSAVITLNCGIDAGLHEILTDDGTGSWIGTPMISKWYPQWFGGYDVTSIQKCVDTIIDMITDDAFGIQNVIELPSGVYDFSSTTLTYPPYIKLKSSGFVIIKYNGTGKCINVTATGSEIPHSGGINTKEMWNRGYWLDGSVGGIQIYNENELAVGSVGLSYGGTPVLDEQIGRYSCGNVAIYKFDIGLEFVGEHNFIGCWDKMHIENNTTDIVFDAVTDDSGENITFNDSIIGGATTGINVIGGGWGINFNSCSLDFLTTMLELGTIGYNVISFNNCHVENHTKLINSTNVYAASKQKDQVSFTGLCRFVLNEPKKYVTGDVLDVRFGRDCNIGYRWSAYITTDDSYDADLYYFIEKGTYSNYVFESSFRRDLDGNIFGNMPIDDEYHNLMFEIGNFKNATAGQGFPTDNIPGLAFGARSAATITATVVDTNYFSEGLSLKYTTAVDTDFLHFKLADDIPATMGDEFLLDFVLSRNTTTTLKLEYSIRAYDASDVLIDESIKFATLLDADTSLDWKSHKEIHGLKCPVKTSYVNIFINVLQFVGDVYIDDIVLFKKG